LFTSWNGLSNKRHQRAPAVLVTETRGTHVHYTQRKIFFYTQRSRQNAKLKEVIRI